MSSAPTEVIYMDHAATTPVRPEVIAAMAPFLSECFGNPSGSHVVARAAVRAMDEAREIVAEIVGFKPGEVIFTSGGTEADNHAITGGLPARRGVPVCTSVEHHAVLDVVQALGGRTVAVDSQCRVDLDSLKRTLAELAESDDPEEAASVVSVMLANNEVGSINDLGPVADLVAEYSNNDRPVPLHTDAVQAAAWLDLRVHAARADMVSISAHKLGGPKGIGALAVRSATPIRPMILGGGQERGRRSGTPSVASIVGFATALRLIDTERADSAARIAELRDAFLRGLLAKVPDVNVTVSDAPVLPGVAHVSFVDADSESVLLLLESAGVVASAGSSCSSGASEPSHVLAAMMRPEGARRGAIRFTLGHTTTSEEVDRALEIIPTAVGRAREFFS